MSIKLKANSDGTSELLNNADLVLKFGSDNYPYDKDGNRLGISELADSDGSGKVGFLQAGTGAAARTLQDKLRDVVSVKDFGAVGDGVTDDAVAIQAAIDAIVTAGGGTLRIPAGTYLIGQTIEIDTGVILLGDGSTSTVLVAAPGLNDDVIRTFDFTNQTLQNIWLTSEGMRHGFGFVGFRVDGNRAENSSGCGFKIYGKRFLVDDIIIVDCAGSGWYSEGANKTGQEDWYDLPEAEIKKISVRNCGDSSNPGFMFRGPHDARITTLMVNGNFNGSDNIRIEALANVYGGSCDIDFIHTYGCSGVGVYASAIAKIQHLIGDTCGKNHVHLDANACQISMLYNFNHNNGSAPGEYPSVLISGSQCFIGGGYIRDNNDGGALAITGSYNNVSGLVITDSGNENTSSAIKLSAWNLCANNIQVSGYNGVGGSALHFVSPIEKYNINIIAEKCSTLFRNDGGGRRGKLTIQGEILEGQTLFTGLAKRVNEDWEFSVVQGATNILSKSYGTVSGVTPDANGNVLIPHSLFTTPIFASVFVRGDSSIEACVQNVDATNITVRLRNTTTSADVTSGTFAIFWDARV